MRRAGRFHFRTAVLALIVIQTIMASSLVASAAPDAPPATTGSASTDMMARFAQSAPTPTPTNTPVPTATPTNTPVPTATPTNTPVPTATPTNTSTPVPTPTPVPDQISINGSEASSVTAVTDGSIRIESTSGWIAFYSDDACGDLSGTERSPFDQATSFFLGLYGRSFSVTGVTESNVPTTTCRQVSIVDPTPTPTGTPTATATPTQVPGLRLLINGYSESKVYVVWNTGSNTTPINFEAFYVPDDPWEVTIKAFQGTCDSLPNSPTYSNTFHDQNQFSVPMYLLTHFANPADGGVAIYAERPSDGVQSPCQMIYFVKEGEEPPTATPSPPVTPTVPTTTEPTPSTTGVTGLPQTGSGSGSPTALPTIILATAMALFVAAFGIERRRRHRRASR